MIKHYFVHNIEIEEAFHRMKAADPSSEDKNPFIRLDIEKASFDFESHYFLVEFQTGNFVRINLNKTKLYEKYEFFNLDQMIYLKSPKFNKEDCILPLLSEEKLRRWYSDVSRIPIVGQIGSQKATITGSAENSRTKFTHLSSNLNKVQTLIINDTEALIVSQAQNGAGAITPVYEVSLGYDKGAFAKLNLERIMEGEGLGENLILMPSFSGFTIFKTETNEGGIGSIGKAYKTNLASVLKAENEDISLDYSTQMMMICVKTDTAEGSLQVVSQLWENTSHKVHFVMAEIDTETFEVLCAKTLIFEEIDHEGVESWLIKDKDSILLYLPRWSWYQQEANLLRGEFKVFNYDLEETGDRIEFDTSSKMSLSPSFFNDKLITIESEGESNQNAIIKIWKISLEKKKFGLKGKRCLKGRSVRKSFINSKGVCLLTTTSCGKEASGHQETDPSTLLFRTFEFRLQTFNLDFEVGMDVDLGKMILLQFGRIEYISGHEVHFLTPDESPWFAIRRSESLGEALVVSFIRYGNKQ